MSAELSEEQQEALDAFAEAAGKLRATRTRSKELTEELAVYQQEKTELDARKATEQQEAQKLSLAFVAAMLGAEEQPAARAVRPVARPVHR